MTTLAKQLAALARPQPLLPAGTKASLLFDVKEASKIEKDIVFAIGANGLDELRQVDDRFLFFFSDLFTSSYADTHYCRDLLPASECASLDGKVSELLPLLAPHFLTKGCHKVLEFLIRYYQVHLHQRNLLLSLLLPFHDTKVFVRLLQLVSLPGSDWECLTNHQKAGAVLLRSDLVTVCCKDLKVMTRVIDTATVSVIHLRFAAVLSAQVIAGVPKLGEGLLHVVVPKVSAWLAAGREQKAAAYILLTQVASRHPFSPDYLNAILLEVLKTAEDAQPAALKLIIFLLKTHPSISIPPNTIDLLLTPAWIQAISTLTANCDTRILTSLVGKRAVGKGEEGQAMAEILISTEKLAPESIETMLVAVLTQFVTQKKTREAKDFPLYSGLLSLIGDRHPTLLSTYLPKAITAVRDSHHGEKTKSKLNSLLSRALSGLPMDENTDLPLYLALNHPLATVRIAAVEQLSPCITHMKSAIFELIRREENYDVLYSVLSVAGLEAVSDDGMLVAAIGDRLATEAEKACKRTDVLRAMVDIICAVACRQPIDPLIVISALVNIAGIDELRETAVAKANELAKIAVVFTQSEPNLETHISNYVVSVGKPAFTSLSGLIRSKLVRAALSTAFSVSKQKTLTEDMAESVSKVVNSLTLVDLSHESTIALASSIIAYSPSAHKTSSVPAAQHTFISAMKLILRLFLPIDITVCLAVLKRHFRERSIEVLTELVPTCAQAVEVIVNIALIGGSANGSMQAAARVFVSLCSEEKDVRTQGIACFSAILKGKPTIETEIAIKIADSPCFVKWESDLSLVSGLLSRIAKHRAGVLSDAHYFPTVISKVATGSDFDFLASCVSALNVHKAVLLRAFDSVKSDKLTETLIETELDRSEKVIVMSRLRHYQNWPGFPAFDWVAELWSDKETTELILEIFTSDVFAALSKENQAKFLFKSLNFLCMAKCGEMSADVHMRLGEIGLSVDLLHDMFERKAGMTVLEKLLTVVQDTFKEPDPTLLSDLFTVLSHLSISAPSPSLEFLKQLTLTCIRLHYPAVLQTPSLLSTHISLLVACVSEGDEYTLQTKAHMYATLAGCCHMFPVEVANQLKDCFKTSTMKHGKLELNIMKKTIEQVGTSLLAHRVSLTGILIAVIEGAGNISLDSEFPALLSDILRKVGAKYLSVSLLHMLSISMSEDSVMAVLGLMPVIDVLEGLVKLAMMVGLLVTRPKTKMEKREVAEGLTRLEAGHLSDPDEITLITANKLLKLFLTHISLPATINQLSDVVSFDSVPELFARSLLSLISSSHTVSDQLTAKKTDLKHVYKLIGKTIKTAIETISALLDSGTFARMHVFALELNEKEAKIDVKRGMLDLFLTKLKENVSKKYTRIVPKLFAVLNCNKNSIKSLNRPNNQAKAAFLDTILIVLRYLLGEKYETVEFFDILMAYAVTPLHQLRTNSLLCLCSFFRSARTDLLPSISPLLSHLFSHIDSTTDPTSLSDAISAACTVLSGMHEFLAPHFPQFLLCACATQANSDALLDSLGRCIPLRLAAAAVAEVLPVLSGKAGPELVRLLSVIEKVVKRTDSADAVANFLSLSHLFESVLAALLRYIEANHDPHPLFRQQVDITVSAITHFSLNLTNAQFRPMIIGICEWQGQKDKDEDKSYRSFVFFSIVNGLSRGMKSYFGAYLKYFIEEILNFVSEFVEGATDKGKKRKRGVSAWAVETNTVVLQGLYSLFRFDKGANLTEQLYDQLSTALVAETGLVCLQDYSQYTRTNVSPCFIELFKSTQDETIWKAINYKLLLQSRAQESQVRVECFRLMSELGTSVGEPFAALVSDIMPFIGEGLEDESDEVTAEAKAAMRMMEKISGEDLREYLK